MIISYIKEVSTMAEVRTRKRGRTWSYIFEVGKQNGKRKVVEKGGFPDRASAYAAGAAAFTDWKHGNIGVTSEAITLEGFLDSWLNRVCRLNVREATWHNYQTMIRLHILPYLGQAVLQKLSPAALDHWILQLAADGLAYKSISLILAILRNALNYAVYPGQLIQSNPAHYIKVPRSAPKNIIERQIISPEQVADILEKNPAGTAFHIPILLLYHTGMRVGEVVGLSWDDIDLDKSTITIQRQARYITAKHGHFFCPPKTDASKRTIVISPALCNALLAWKAQQAKNELCYGGSYICVYSDSEGRAIKLSKKLPPPLDVQREQLVCTKENGAIISVDTLRWKLRQEGLNSHSFRHTHATVLIEHGATPKGVAARLGHASTSITQDLYTHNTKKLDEDTAKIFETAITPMQTSPSCRQIADK